MKRLLLIISIVLFSSSIFAHQEHQIQALKTLPVKSVVSMRDFLIAKGQTPSFDNEVKLITLSDGTQAVFKPVPKDDMGDAYGEVAAFKASQLLGFPVIPPTIIRKMDGEIGSLQLYVEPAIDIISDEVYNTVLKNVSLDDLANLKLFYFVFGQWDTGPHNLIVTKESNQFKLVAIDNSGIISRQYVKYGQTPFVRICYSEALNTNDWHKPFPYQDAKKIKSSFENLSKIFIKKIPEPVLKRLSRYNTLNYVIHKNSLWVQFHQFDPTFVISHTNHYPEKTIEILRTLNKEQLNRIFKDAKGSDFLTDDYLTAILERRDQVIDAYENHVRYTQSISSCRLMSIYSGVIPYGHN